MFFLRKSPSYFLLGTLLIPLNHKLPSWHTSVYSDIKPNTISFTAGSLSIHVDSSSSPLFYMLPKPVLVRTVKVQGEISGLPSLKTKTEDSKEGDDLAFRLGLVESSVEPPSIIARFLAPNWIRILLDYLPEQGIKTVRFLTVSQEKSVGAFRFHPQNDLIQEIVALRKRTPGKFEINYRFKAPAPTMALWIQPDGDDTQSQFTLKLNRIELETVETVSTKRIK
ncbi:MAG: hypothetical protein NT000_06725 [Proteobacteria bacterium]|nr:hypothetical protein [Pseudomonadota bacterium]